MNRHQAKDLFQLQSELVKGKVDMAVTKAIDRVVDQIRNLKHEVHEQMYELREQMTKQFSAIRHVESELASIKDAQREFRNRFVDYLFRAAWLVLAGSFSYVIIHFFGLIK